MTEITVGNSLDHLGGVLLTWLSCGVRIQGFLEDIDMPRWKQWAGCNRMRRTMKAFEWLRRWVEWLGQETADASRPARAS